MDKDQAKFILASFRPDGADAADPEFAEALALATENRELADWLAHERAFDAGFSSALGELPLPQGLRDEILGSFAIERGDFPQAEDPFDAAMVGGLASIQPPAGLRSQLLAATSQSATAPVENIVRPLWKRFAVPLAAAAGIAFAFLMTRDPAPEATASTKPISIDVVQAGFIHTYQSPIFSLDAKRSDHRELISLLRERSLPCPCDLPPGLKNVRGIGCRELIIDGKRGSLICFDEQENGVVHLVVFDRKDISNDQPLTDQPTLGQSGEWATAKWEHNGKALMLIGHTSVDKLSDLF